MVKLKTRKAQVKMFETIAVIIVFFFLLAVGFVFYANMQRSSIESKLKEEQDTRAMKIAKTAINLPELQCNGKTYCFDVLKIDAFETYSNADQQTRTAYFDMFRNSVIKIKQVYPPVPPDQYISIYSRPKGNSKQSIRIPVTISQPVAGTTTFGILVVDVYE